MSEWDRNNLRKIRAHGIEQAEQALLEREPASSATARLGFLFLATNHSSLATCPVASTQERPTET